MTNATINIAPDVRRTATLKEWVAGKRVRVREAVTRWMASKNELYSQICEQRVTNRLAVQINAIAVCLGLVACTAATAPIVAAMAAVPAAWLVKRINNEEKKGNRQ